MIKLKHAAVAQALALLLICVWSIPLAHADFGITDLSVTATGPDGTADYFAGSHPDLTVSAHLNLQENEPNLPQGDLKSIIVQLPPGLVGNPLSVPRCSRLEFEGSSPQCPVDSQIGVARLEIGGGIGVSKLPLFNVAPPFGSPAQLAFSVLSTNSFQTASLRSDSDFGIDVSDLAIPNYHLLSVEETVWGVPGDPSHDAERTAEVLNGQGSAVPFGGPVNPFLTLPTSCRTSLKTTVTVASFQEPDRQVSASVQSLDGTPGLSELDGCNALAFEPTIESRATTDVADSPSGLDFTIHQPQDETTQGRATAALEGAQVTLPEGLTLNASAANGLESCTEGQIGYAPSGSKIRFSKSPQACPNAAKVGTLEVTTPLLDHSLAGAVYVAKPFANPFGSLLAIYLAIEDEQSGTVAKLAGRVDPDPQTGRLTATFTENPQLPIEDINLHFFNGPGAALKTPLTCGAKITTSTLTPWSAPEGIDVHPTGSFQITKSCSASEAAAPKTVKFDAGTVSPLAGAYSPFTLHIARPDGTQRISAISTTLPAGLVGRLAGIPYCAESGISQAIAREAVELGKLEQSSPSCPQTSEVGTVEVTAGAGITPIPVSGHAYLAGPYRGAPLSLAVIVPAVAGPFDLGTVVNRVALIVDQTSAQISAVSDPLPTIRDGIPLDVRSIDLKLGRSDFTLNPTSCDAKEIVGSVATSTGQSAPLHNRFQVGECGPLAFKPRLRLSLTGSAQRSKNPALKAVLTQPPGQANIRSASVTLPRSEFIDNRHISNPCTRVQFDAGAGNGEQCPADSILGYARAYTPLLDEPLQGPVYFRSNGGERNLPDLVASLNGQVHLNVVGFIDSVRKKGSEVSRMRNTFSTVPDAPVSRFVLELRGGKKGLLQNSVNLCKVKNVAQVKFDAQNGKSVSSGVQVGNSCGSGKSKKGHRAEGEKHRGR